MNSSKPIIYFDMDGVLVDFRSGIDAMTLSEEERRRREREHTFDEVPGIFARMKPTHGAVRAVKELAKHYDLRILTTAPWGNPSAWTDKLLWVKRHFIGLIEPDKKNTEGNPFFKKITITHCKDRVFGGVLVEDNLSKNGAGAFPGEKIWFHLPANPVASCPETLLMTDIKEVTNWYDLLSYLMPDSDPSWKAYENELIPSKNTKTP